VTRIADIPDALTQRISRGLALLDACEAIQAASDKAAIASPLDAAQLSHDYGDWSLTLGEHAVTSASLDGALLAMGAEVRP
jgi:hypothetical protein